MKYDFISDDGHGWLKAPLNEVKDIKISSYSYMDNEHAYLEEDCDFTAFAKMKGWKTWNDIEPNINKVYHRGQSPIRNLNSYINQ